MDVGPSFALVATWPPTGFELLPSDGVSGQPEYCFSRFTLRAATSLSMRPSVSWKQRILLIGACLVWAGALGTGLALLWNYENAPGPTSLSPVQWPEGSRIERDPELPTLVMVAHPHCPCTRASVGELARVIAQTYGKVRPHIVVVKPPGAAEDWVNSDLVVAGESIPGVKVIIDEGGVEARLFNALTSGHTFLYDHHGRLLFSGGITASRGHSGDNAGRSSIVSLLRNEQPDQQETFVFGCQLFDDSSECEGTQHVGSNN